MPLSVFLVIAVIPSVSFALNASGNTTVATGNSTCPQGQICNPLNYNSLSEVFVAFLNIIAQVAAVACAVWIIWAGFLFIEARGNSEKLEDAKRTITHALIGTAIILGANVILMVVQNTINAIKS